MQTWAILTKHAALTSGVGFGTISVPGWGSLEVGVICLLFAGIGLAVASARRAPACPIGPAGGQVAAAQGGSTRPGGRMSRIRRRVDGVLTGMLSDDEDKLTSDSNGRTTAEPAEADENRFEAPSTWDGDYVDALPWHLPAKPPDPYPAVLPRSPDPNLASRASAGRSSGIAGLPESSVTPWPQPPRAYAAGTFSDSPWLTVSAAFDGEQLWPLGNRRPGETRKRGGRRTAKAANDLDQFHPLPPPAPRRDDLLPTEPVPGDKFKWFGAAAASDHDAGRDEAIDSSDEQDARRWSAGPAGAADEVSGYRSKHRLDGPGKEARPQEARKPKARHAAPGSGVAGSGLARKRGPRPSLPD
ncbi:MAG TPA: hypothetical protein VJT16_18055 [Streptosporangiaceae bacterium]|nr:hypothetical protein [Streptosporangiaceae bacterium]